MKFNQNLAGRAAAAARNFRRNAARVGVGGAALMPVLAFAQASDPGAAITAEITNAKTTVSGILIVLAGIVGLMLLWAYVKRAK